MKKLLIITFTLLLLMSASLMATGTRVGTMGDNNMILLDDANIWMFPSRINDYPNMAVAEFSDNYNTEFGRFGIHWQFNEENPCVLGTYFYDATTMGPMYSPFGSPFYYNYRFVPFDHSLWSNQRIDLFYGRIMSGNPFGVHLSLINSSQKEQDPADLDEEGFSVYDFSFGWTLSGNTDIAAGLSFMSWTHKDTYKPDTVTATAYTAYDKTKAKGNMALFAGIRHFMPTGDPDYTLVPHAMLYYGKNKAEYYGKYSFNVDEDTVILQNQTDEYKWLSFDFGAGLQYAPSSDVMAVLDFGIKYEKVDGDFTENTYTISGGTAAAGADSISDASAKTFTLPYFKAGLDAKVFKWMDIRFGATTYWDRETVEGNWYNDSNTKNSHNWANNDTYLGFGFHWGNLHVDTHADPDLFLRGFNFISGENGSDMNFSLSALYEFE